MHTAIIQLITAFLGTLGFALIFNVGRKFILPATLCGFFACGIYLLCYWVFLWDNLVSNIVAACFCQLYAELFARIMKSPTTVFYIPGIIPLIPGGALYNTMYSVVQKDFEMAKYYGIVTLQTALGVAIGLSLISALMHILMSISHKRALKQ